MAVKGSGSPKSAFAEALKLAHIGSREAQYEVGLMFANGVGTEQSLEKAMEWVGKAAQRGLPSAQYLLATRYASGIAVTQDTRAALWWYQNAAEQGHLKAQYKLGKLLVQPQVEAGLAAIRSAAGQGLAEAQYALGQALDKGSAGARNPEQAFDWYQRAAVQGLAQAQCALGDCYAQGQGVAIDMDESLVWYRKAAQQHFAKAQLALEYLSPTDLRKGRGRKKASAAERRQEADRWVRVADAADADAKYCVGLMYDLALGVEHDPHVAHAMYLSAARAGHAKAQSSLAALLERSDPQAARDWYEKAAGAGDPDAQHALARILSGAQDAQSALRAVLLQLQAAQSGHAGAQLATAKVLGTDRSWLGKGLLQMAANGGDPQAQYAWGCCLAEGKEGQQNRLQAAQWWEKAALAGQADAASALGGALLTGAGVKQDPAGALRWLQVAAQAGDAKAQWNLGGMYVSGAGGLTQDMAQAFVWCHKAADLGFAPAQATLGVLYERTGKAKEALHWLNLAAASGDPEAQYNLALMCRSGKGSGKDLELGFVYLCQAAEQGVASAQTKLGVAYGAGEGVAVDPIEAHKWLVIAQHRGDPVAQANLLFSQSQMDAIQIKEAMRRAEKWLKK